MPWYAQYEDLPETHWHFADAGSELAGAFDALGYVVVRPAEVEVEVEQPLAEPVPATSAFDVLPVAGQPRPRARRGKSDA